jgi:hypothetical protein
MQRDDDTRADVEIAHRGEGWQREVVDCGAGGGIDNALVFDSEDRPVAFQRTSIEFSLVERHGLWVHRRGTDGTWLRLLLAAGGVDFQESSAVAGDAGYVAAAYYDPVAQTSYVVELLDPEHMTDAASWSQEQIGEDRYAEGLYPSIAFNHEGELAIAYYRCNQVDVAGVCDPAHDAVVYAWRTGGTWHREIVDEGGDALCGTFTSLGIAPDGTVSIAYVCHQRGEGPDTIAELRVATRAP